MDARGFWRAAEAEPDRSAVILEDGTRVAAGELLASCNRVVHGLRARGVARGDCVAMLLPNGVPILEVLLAAMQSGWYITPINTNLAAPEIAYILRDSHAMAFVTHAAFGETCAAAADEAGLDGSARFAVGSIAGFEDYAALKDGQPVGIPDDRVSGTFMQYTSGTTGRPKGIRRDLVPMDPDVMWPLYAQHLSRFDIEPGAGNVHLCTSPMYHTAPLAYTSFSLHYEHAVSLMERWSPETALRMIERDRVTTTHMVPTQFHRLLQLPEEAREIDTTMSRPCATCSTPPRPAPSTSSAEMLDWWGPVIYEYYGATEGGGTLVKPRRLARAGRERWDGPGRAPRSAFSTTRATTCPAGEPGARST